ncbi:hypothetical protein [Niveispirillum irakense]|uniref:hypothetical protein n=1 Tax=Niveispirillum irakense TaxID=34011 RepID=UPI000688F9D9|nr:hypothetical protein [Niveispirillum irakense]
MTMLEGAEFSVGSLGHFDGLCLIVPRTEYERLILAAPGEPQKAVFLDGQHSFRGFTPSGRNWEGIVVPNIRVEVDLSSAVSINRHDAPIGTIVREEDFLAILAGIQGSYGFMEPHKIPLLSGLPPCQGDSSVGFHKWQIVLGEGQAKRVLRTFDVTPPKP